MFKNPLIQRYQYSLLRPKQKWIFMSIYLIVLVLIFLISDVVNFDLNRGVRAADQGFSKTVLVQVFVLQIILLCVWATYNSSAAIRDEIVQRTHDFFRMLPLSAERKTIGILLGKNCIVLMLSCINLFIVIFFACVIEIPFRIQSEALILLISTTVLLNLVALLGSTFITKENKTSNITGFGGLMLLFFIIAPIIGGGVEYLSNNDIDTRMHWVFYGLKMPIMIFISLIEVYFSGWVFTGILRRFNYEHQPLFTFQSAIIFLFGYFLVIWGSCWVLLIQPDALPDVFIIVLIFGFIPLIFLPFGSMKSSYDYLEYCSQYVSSKEDKQVKLITLIKYSNLCLWVVLFCVFWIFLFLAANVLEVSMLLVLLLGATFFTFYLFVLLLIEMNVVYKPVISKIKNLLITIYLFYLIMLTILGSIFGGLMVVMGTAVLCAIPAYFILKRYLFMIKQEKITI